MAPTSTNEQRIEQIYKGIQDIKVEMAKYIVHQEQHRSELDEHKALLIELEARKNKQDGFIALLGIIFGGVATYIVTYLTKHS